MALEYRFFAAQPLPAAPRALPGALIVDFDETCTPADTTGVVIDTAIAAAAARAAELGRTPGAVTTELQSLSRWLVDNYIKERQLLLADILPEGMEGAAEYDEDWLCAFTERLSGFDRAMNRVVEESKVLAGVSRQQLQQAGRGITLRPGCADVLRRASAAGVATHVVSVNWSGAMVSEALTAAGCVAGGPGRRCVQVHANELEYDEEGHCTGAIQRRIECGTDKARVFDTLILDAAADAAPGAADDATASAAGGSLGAGAGGGHAQGLAPGVPSVYVGDSPTDLLPLLGADVGIVVGGNELLRRVAAAAGVALKPLAAAPPLHTAVASSAPDQPVLYTTHGWQEVGAYLLGPPEEGAPEEGARQPTAVLSEASGSVPAPADRTNGAGGSSAAAAGQVTGTAVAGGDRVAPRVPRALTVAGSDSGGGAGIQADLKTFAALGVYGCSAVTALTAQNSRGVQGVLPVEGGFVAAQLNSVLGDIGTDAVKTGMLPSPEVVEAVGAAVRQYGIACLVVDPVMVATSGDALATPPVLAAIRDILFPLAALVTPNVPEAAALLGGREITDTAAMQDAARALHALGPRAVLVKGGHLAGSGSGTVTDVLYDGRDMVQLTSPYVRTGNTHGTGCTLAAGVAAGLARGLSLRAAVDAARGYLHACLVASAGLPLGAGPQRAMNHAFRTSDWTRPAAPLDLRLYAVTDPSCNARTGRSNAEAVAAAVAGGATVVQLREKDCDGGDFCREAAAVLAVCRRAGVPLLINDRVDVALAVGADGVHVGQSDMPAAAARALLGPGRFLGVSVKSPQEAVAAQAAGADYLGCGAVVPTSTKSDSSVVGLEGLRAVCASTSLPVVAIGGVNAANACDTIQAGCAGIAVVSAIFGVADAQAAARELLHAVDDALSQQGGREVTAQEGLQEAAA